MVDAGPTVPAIALAAAVHAVSADALEDLLSLASANRPTQKRGAPGSDLSLAPAGLVSRIDRTSAVAEQPTLASEPRSPAAVRTSPPTTLAGDTCAAQHVHFDHRVASLKAAVRHRQG
jgi:hypothetical protein